MEGKEAVSLWSQEGRLLESSGPRASMGARHVPLRHKEKHLRSHCSRQARRPSGAAMAVASSGPMLLSLQNKEGVVNPLAHYMQAVRGCVMERRRE
jgi:hypothetical protein